MFSRDLLKLTVSVAMAVPLSAGAFVVTAGDILISNHGGSNVQRLEVATGIVSTLTNVASTPIGLAFDSNFNLYINNGSGISRLDKATDVLTQNFFAGNGQREGLAFDSATGHLFSASFGGGRIEEVDLAGNLVNTIIVAGLTQPIGISARGGKLLVTDYTDGQVYVGSTSGGAFSLVGTVAPGNTYAVDIDALANVYVNSFGAGKVIKFTPTGGGYTQSDFITGLGSPANGLSIGDDGSLTISEFGLNAVSIWNSDGSFRQRFTGIQSPDELVVFAPQRANPNPTPEPGAILLVATGLLGLLVSRRSAR